MGRIVDAETLLALGLLLTVAGLVSRFARELRRDASNASARVKSVWLPRSLAGRATLAVVVLVGAGFRLHELDVKSLNHTEVYVPGIDLPPGISEPPPRHALAETVSWHFHDEPHPQGYYLLGWVWTKLFGTSVISLRLPSVLFGVGAIVLLHRLGALAGGGAAGLLAAAMLALHGLHIYWSQMARMYAMTVFLGLLSALLLVRLAAEAAPRPRRELAYVAVTFWGVFTEVLFWPFLAAQMLWTAVALRPRDGRPDRLLRLQALVLMLGAPLWAHAIYRSREIDLGAPRLEFLRQYLTFGFLFEPDPFAVEPFVVAPPLALALLAAALLLGFAARPESAPPTTARSGAGDGGRAPFVVAAGCAAFTLGLALLAHRRREAMALPALLPLVALALPRLLAGAVHLVAPRPPSADEPSRPLRHPLAACATLAFVPAALMYLVSIWFPLLQSRLFLLFTPFLLVLAATGAARLGKTPGRLAVLAGLLVAVHLGSAVQSRARFSTPREYKLLAADLEREFRPGDLVFARHRHWATTPLFYYLDRSREAIVTLRFERAKRHNPRARIFLVDFGGEPPPDLARAVAGLSVLDVLARDRSRIVVYGR